MTVSLNTHLQANPRGRKYSFALRIRGFPYLWTDGLATWTYADCDEIIDGGLGKTDFNFDYKSDPLSPLEVGGGHNFTLIDEPSRRTRYLFSPHKVPTWSGYIIPSTAGIIPTDTTILVNDTTGASGNLYLGQETVYVETVDSGTQLTVTRGMFGTTKQKHRSRFEGVAAGARGTEISSLPTVWRGRYVDVYMAPVLEDGTAGTRYTIWAGRLGGFTLTGKSIRLSCDNLTAGITKDDWPDPLPAIHTGHDIAHFYLKPEDMHVVVNYSNFSSAAASGHSTNNDGVPLELGTLDITGATFTKWTTAGWYTLVQICQAVTDTIIYATSEPNGFTMYVSDDRVTIRIRNDSTYYFRFDLNKGVFRLMRSALFLISPSDYTHLFPPGSDMEFLKVPAVGFVIDESAEKAEGYVLTKNDLLTTEGCKNYQDDMLGYARITRGSDIELVSFNTSTTLNGLTGIDFVERGLGGTTRRHWGLEEGQELIEDVKIEQVCVISSGISMNAAEFLLYLLLSVDGDTGLNHASYDKLGSRFGLGYHPDHVDYDGILSRMELGDMPRPYMWWVDEVGKGKEALEQFMKMHGVYFVTRRFERSGTYLFGLSVDLVDVPVPSRYNLTVDDAFRSADSPVDVDINERLIVNVISLAPAYRYGEKDSDAGGKIYETAEDSINKYGAAKALELKSSAMFSDFYGIQQEAALAAALTTAVSLRWFGGLSTGNFMLTLETPHVGWMIQPGDRILLNLTGAANPTGEDGFTGSIVKVVDVKHSFGSKAGAKATFRLSLGRAAELVPCFNISSIAGNPTVTLYANNFSKVTADVPFDGDTLPVKDAHWFQATKHTDGAGLRVYVWERGNFANYVERGVVSTSITASTLTLDSALPGGLTGVLGAGGQLLGCFIDYDDPTTLMSTYAYIGSNTIQSELGTLDASTTDVEAFEWS